MNKHKFFLLEYVSIIFFSWIQLYDILNFDRLICILSIANWFTRNIWIPKEEKLKRVINKTSITFHILKLTRIYFICFFFFPRVIMFQTYICFNYLSIGKNCYATICLIFLPLVCLCKLENNRKKPFSISLFVDYFDFLNCFQSSHINFFFSFLTFFINRSSQLNEQLIFNG